MRLTVLRALPLSAVVLVVALALPSAASAQPPQKQDETYKNLKVLPPDTTKAQLTVIMHGFTDGLGVHCDFCHAGQGRQMDWASD